MKNICKGVPLQTHRICLYTTQKNIHKGYVQICGIVHKCSNLCGYFFHLCKGETGNGE